MCDLISLRNDPNKIPAKDVLSTYYTPWNPENQPIARCKGKDKILLEDNTNGDEFTFTTPPVSILDASINNEQSKKHTITISKIWPQPWNGNTLPHFTNDNIQKIWFEKLETIAYQCLKIAFDNPDYFKDATEMAWANASGEENSAWNIFLAHANLPFTANSWTLKKNTTKGKNKQHVTIVDIDNMEHTGNVKLQQGGIVSVSIKLWPYHMNKHCYGISAGIGNAGIKVYDKGGVKTPRTNIKIPHTCIVKAGDSHKFIYDVFGGLYQFKLHAIVCDDGQMIPSDEQFVNDFSMMLEHFKKHNIECDKNIIIHDWVHNHALHVVAVAGCFKGYVTLECRVVNDKLIYKLIKLN